MLLSQPQFLHLPSASWLSGRCVCERVETVRTPQEDDDSPCQHVSFQAVPDLTDSEPSLTSVTDVW
jgi:hypothetical protein